MAETKKFQRSRNVTRAKACMEHAPRIHAEHGAVQMYEAENSFKHSASASIAIAPAQLAQTGTAMICMAPPSTGTPSKTISENVATEKQYGPFRVQDHHLIYGRVVNGEERQDVLANFVVQPTEIIKKIGVSDVEILLGFDVVGELSIQKGSIPLKDYITKMSRVIRGKWPEFRIYDIGKNAEKIFQEYLSRVYSAVKGDLPCRELYLCAGWNDKNQYLSGADFNCESDRILPDVSALSAAELYKWNYRILSLSRDRNIGVLLDIQFHTDVLIKPFEDAGSPIQHLTDYAGGTGSRKTSTARVLNGSSFNLNSVVNFTATDAGINLMVKSRCRDATLVLDNLSNAMDRSMLRTLNQFLLQFGDSDGRVKTANGGKDLVQNEIRCAVVITSESQLEYLQLSNRLRTLSIPFTRDTIDNTLLSNFQWDRKVSKLKKCSAGLDQYKTAFIKYVEAHYLDLVEFIAFFQPPEMQLRFARQARTYKNLVAIAAIVLKFGRDCGALSEGQDSEIMANEWLPAIQKIMRYNEMLCYTDEPHKLFLRAIVSGVAQRLLPVTSSKEAFQTCSAQALGFWDGQVLKLDPTRAYAYVINIYRAKGFAATADDIWTALRDKGISEGYADKSKRTTTLFKKVKLNGTQIDMLCLNWKEVEKAMSEDENL